MRLIFGRFTDDLGWPVVDHMRLFSKIKAQTDDDLQNFKHEHGWFARCFIIISGPFKWRRAFWQCAGYPAIYKHLVRGQSHQKNPWLHHSIPKLSRVIHLFARWVETTMNFRRNLFLPLLFGGVGVICLVSMVHVSQGECVKLYKWFGSGREYIVI